MPVATSTMKVKLTHEEAKNLWDMIEYLLKEFPADVNDPAELLLDALVNKFRIKLRNKFDSDPRAGYAISLPKEEGLAFEIWMNQMGMVIKPMTYVYEINTATKITNEINRIYG